MLVSTDVVGISIESITKKIPTGFFANCIQTMEDNQGAITTMVGVLTLSVLAFQLYIMHRQTKISERANEISREIAFLPIQEKILWDWLGEVESLKKQLYYITKVEFTPQNTIELLTNIRRSNAIFSLKSKRSALFFPPEVADEIKKYSSSPKDFNNLTSAIEKRYHYMNGIKCKTPQEPYEYDEEFNDSVNVKPGEMDHTIYELNEIVIKSIEDSEINVISKLIKHDF